MFGRFFRGFKPFYTKIGAEWKNKKGGYGIRLEAHPVGGEIVLFPPKGNIETVENDTNAVTRNAVLSLAAVLYFHSVIEPSVIPSVKYPDHGDVYHIADIARRKETTNTMNSGFRSDLARVKVAFATIVPV